MTPRVLLALEHAGVTCSGDEVRDAWGLAIRCRDGRVPPPAAEPALRLALALMQGHVDAAESAADALLASERPSLAALDAMVAPAAPPPASEPCARCVHLARCAWLIGRDGSERSCDWTPSRFRLPLAAGEVQHG